MNTNTLKLSSLALALTATALTSCQDDDDDDKVISKTDVVAGLVTVKPKTDNAAWYLQLDDSTTLHPLNVADSPYGDKEVRALITFTTPRQETATRDFDIYLHRIDSILTKPCAKNLGDDNARVYGNDPVEINTADWVNIAEDGYLTVRFHTQWASSRAHWVNLVASNNPDEPYTLTFHHNANGEQGGHWGYGVVAFRLDQLPDTNGKTVDLTLKWNSYEGERSATMKYCSRRSSGSKSLGLLGGDYETTVE